MNNMNNKEDVSIFDRLISKKRPVWVTLVVSLLFLLLPFAAAYLDGALGNIFKEGQWRVFLLAPVIIIYIWMVSPIMTRMAENVFITLRPLVQLDDEDFDRIIYEASRLNPLHEWLAFGFGLVLGIAASLASEFDADLTWLRIYWFLATALLYGILAWTIYVAVASTRVTAALHRQPMRIDILALTPFEAIGRQSLVLALVFLGGITLSLLLSFQLENLTTPEFWIIYVLLIMVTLLIFFLNMYPAHRVLAAEKERQLAPVQRHIHRSCQDLVLRLEEGVDTGHLGAEINALEIYEKRLQAARTWPYNTSMLRALLFSVLIPIGSLLARVAIEFLLP